MTACRFELSAPRLSWQGIGSLGEGRNAPVNSDFDLVAFVLRNAREILGFGSAGLAVVAALIAGRQARRADHFAQLSVRRQSDELILRWGEEAIEALAEAQDLCDRMDLPDFREQQLAVARTLSALVDRGRLYFPNIDDKGHGFLAREGHGAHKEAAFRGWRPPILDALMFAFYEVRALGQTEACKQGGDYIWRCRRLFVSELQSHVDPKEFDLLLERFNRKSRDDQAASVRQASTLRAELMSRRPGAIDESDVAPRSGNGAS